MGLANSTTCYWEVNATGDGGTGSWLNPDSFTTVMATPVAPVLVVPTSGAANQPTSLTLSWSSVAGAASYGFLVSTASGFATTIAGQSGLTVPAASIAGLADSATYLLGSERSECRRNEPMDGMVAIYHHPVEELHLPARSAPAGAGQAIKLKRGPSLCYKKAGNSEAPGMIAIPSSSTSHEGRQTGASTNIIGVFPPDSSQSTASIRFRS